MMAAGGAFGATTDGDGRAFAEQAGRDPNTKAITIAHSHLRGGMPDRTDKKLIDGWRRRATAIRTAARSMGAGERRDALFRLAELYDLLADQKRRPSGSQDR